MKICIVTESYLRGGLDTFLISLINGWPSDKDEFTLYVNREHQGIHQIIKKIDKPVSLKMYSNFSTHMSSVLNRDNSKTRSLFKSRLLIKLFIMYESTFFWLWCVIRDKYKFTKSDFDRLLVVNGGYPGGLNCRSALVGWRLTGRKPLGIMSFHSHYSKPDSLRTLLNMLINFSVARSISVLVSVSKDCLESLSSERSFNLVRNKQIIYNGIEDPGDTHSTDLDQKFNSTPYCIMLGTFLPHKGHSYLFKAFEVALTYIPNLRLSIYGDGSEKNLNRLKNEIRILNLTNQIDLFRYSENIHDAIRKSSVLLVPSQGYESFGLTILEAMSMRVPVVATNVGGIPEVIGDSAGGHMCSKDDPIQFGNLIVQIISNRELTLNMGAAGRKRFEDKFTHFEMSKKYKLLLDTQ